MRVELEEIKRNRRKDELGERVGKGDARIWKDEAEEKKSKIMLHTYHGKDHSVTKQNKKDNLTGPCLGCYR